MGNILAPEQAEDLEAGQNNPNSDSSDSDAETTHHEIVTDSPPVAMPRVTGAADGEKAISGAAPWGLDPLQERNTAESLPAFDAMNDTTTRSLDSSQERNTVATNVPSRGLSLERNIAVQLTSPYMEDTTHTVG
jgi:hypothetical protein